MQITLSPAAQAAARSGARIRTALLALYTGCAVLMRLGAVWDVQWHSVVGRDTFWIPPHLLLYSSVACCGLLAAAAVLPAGMPRRNTAWPWGMFVGGLGVVLLLAAAPFDDLWHRRYGIDVTIWSPPHMVGVLGAWVVAWGALLAWRQELVHRRGAEAQRVQEDRGWLSLYGEYSAFALSAALILGFANFGLIPALRWSFTQPHTPYLYPLLAGLAGHWWSVLPIVAAMLLLRLVEQGLLELNYRVVIELWGERLRDEPGPIYRIYTLGALLASAMLLGMGALAWARRNVRGRREAALLGATGGLLLWVATLLVHLAWDTSYGLGSYGTWREEAGWILDLTGGAGPAVALATAVVGGAFSGLAGGLVHRRDAGAQRG
jgi:hypothetical protein